jgi:AcrR family transcriptional regulator
MVDLRVPDVKVAGKTSPVMPRAKIVSPARRSPGRPRRSPDRESEVRARITHIAARLFREEGIAALSVRRIAREARLPVMTLYDYFPSKTEIIRSMWDRFLSKCFDRVDRAAADRDRKPRERLEAACAVYTRYWLDHPDEYRAVFMIEDKVEKQEKYYIETSNLLARYSVFARLLGAHLCNPDITSEQLLERAVALVCALNGICHMLVTVSEYRSPPPERLLEQVLRMVD